MGETILQEAERIVYGTRQAAYDHPARDYEKTSLMWTGLLVHKLKPGERITTEEAVLMMVLLKASREQHRHGRDNLVDIVGYVLCLERIKQLRESVSSGSWWSRLWRWVARLREPSLEAKAEAIWRDPLRNRANPWQVKR